VTLLSQVVDARLSLALDNASKCSHSCEHDFRRGWDHGPTGSIAMDEGDSCSAVHLLYSDTRCFVASVGHAAWPRRERSGILGEVGASYISEPWL